MTRLVVDGYNVAHVWPPTRALLDRRAPLVDVRRLLVERLAAYAAVAAVEVTVVFDGVRRPPGGVAAGGVAGREGIDGVEVLFSSRELGGADHVIERLVYEVTRGDDPPDVRVATADRLIRDMVRAMGAVPVDPLALLGEVAAAAGETDSRIRHLADSARVARRVEEHLPGGVRADLERLRRGPSATGPGGGAPAPPPPPAPRPPRRRERFRPFDPARDLPGPARPGGPAGPGAGGAGGTTD